MQFFFVSWINIPISRHLTPHQLGCIVLTLVRFVLRLLSSLRLCVATGNLGSG